MLAGALLAIGAPVVMAQDETTLDEQVSKVVDGVLVGVRDDVALAAGEAADAVVVVQGDALIDGDAGGVVAIDANVTIQGPDANGRRRLHDRRHPDGRGRRDGRRGHVPRYDARPARRARSRSRFVTSARTSRATLGWLAVGFATFVLIIWLGLGVSTLVSGLLMIAFGTSQARRAAWLIGNHPLKVLVAGFLAAVLPWLLFVLLSVTIIGIPLAFGLAVVWGLAVFLGYLVAGLWVGEHVLRSSRNSARPYGAVFVGVLILLLLSWFPLVTFFATWFGLGAVTMAGWRVLRGGGRAAAPPPVYGQPYGQQQPYYAPQYPPPYIQPPYGQPVEQWPAADRWPPQQPPASWPG